MMKIYHEMCQRLNEELENAERRVEKTDKLSNSDLDYLSHLIDNIKDLEIIIAMNEEKEHGYSNYYPYIYDDYSYARRGNVKRDTMGRYSRDDKHIAHELRELMDMTTDSRTRQELQKLIDSMER